MSETEIMEGLTFLIILGLFFGGLMISTGLAYIFCPELREEIKRDWNRI